MSDELAESLQNPNVVTVVEWSDIVQNVLPKDRLSIDFKLTANNTEEREITISYPETKSAIIKRLETDWLEIEP